MSVPTQPYPSENARIFVKAELIVNLLCGVIGAAFSIWFVASGRCSFGEAFLVGLASALLGCLLHLILMGYRLITYVIGFMQMAELLDATRLLLQQLFTTSAKPPTR